MPDSTRDATKFGSETNSLRHFPRIFQFFARVGQAVKLEQDEPERHARSYYRHGTAIALGRERHALHGGG